MLAMVLVLEGTLYPVPEASKNWLPYSFLGYLAAPWYSSVTTSSKTVCQSGPSDVDE